MNDRVLTHARIVSAATTAFVMGLAVFAFTGAAVANSNVKFADTATVAAPVLTPIQAVFTPSLFHTVYTEHATGEDLRYLWSVEIPLDPACAAGFQRTTPGTAQVTWFHADESEGGTCNHNGNAYSASAGHPGLVIVVVSNSQWRCVATYYGTLTGTGQPPAQCTVGSSTQPPTTTGSTDNSFPTWIIFVGLVAVLIGFGAWFAVARRKDDCDDLVARCEQLRAAAAELEKLSAAADDKAKAAQAAYNDAKATRAKAQAAANAADNPSEGQSWMEDADTGVRLTEYDLQLQRQAGGAEWGDPAKTAQLREQAKAAAHARLDDAVKAEATARAAAEAASADAQRADAATAAAEAEAGAACRAAQECLDAAATAKKAADDAARQVAVPVAAAPAATAPPTVSPPVTPPPANSPVASAPPVVPPKTASRPRECDEGDEPVIDDTSIDLELCLVWAATVSVDGAYQFSEGDVEEALAGFERFKVAVDIAEFLEGFGESGGDLASGAAGIDAKLNTLTNLVDTGFSLTDGTNWSNPQATAEDAVMDQLKKLIEKVNTLRLLGEWTMTCPLMKVHATCHKKKECRGGYWVVTEHTFNVTYGPKVRDVSFERFNADHDNPGRGAVATRSWLYRQFENRNRAARKKLEDFAKACAASR